MVVPRDGGVTFLRGCNSLLGGIKPFFNMKLTEVNTGSKAQETYASFLP